MFICLTKTIISALLRSLISCNHFIVTEKVCSNKTIFFDDVFGLKWMTLDVCPLIQWLFTSKKFDC